LLPIVAPWIRSQTIVGADFTASSLHEVHWLFAPGRIDAATAGVTLANDEATTSTGVRAKSNAKARRHG
jgi:hypothetical protein